MKATALQAKKRKSETVFHVMLLPAVVFCLIFSYVPLGGLVIAFQKFKPAKGLFGPQDWIGMGNFRYLLEMPNTVNVLRNTLVISLWKMVLGILVPLAVALLINEVANTRFKRSVQTIIFMPYFLSWIILSGIFIQMLSPADGLANQFIGLFGAEPIFFLGDNRWFQGTVIATDVWKTFGFNTIVFFAAITSIDPCLYESAKIDGAGRMRQCLSITIPCIMGTIVLLGVLSMGNILNAGFDQIFNMYSPIVYETGDILDTFVYRLGIREAQYGVAAAVGFFKSIISTLFISASYFMAYKFADYRIF
ncbi:MAG: ABC transporter permease subunit [Clostridiales bacterium]|jgi:putative aldouronate transport system permease protein|nr:ABC transporter permease subunit [Clostridiales bacterium]